MKRHKIQIAPEERWRGGEVPPNVAIPSLIFLHAMKAVVLLYIYIYTSRAARGGAGSFKR